MENEEKKEVKKLFDFNIQNFIQIGLFLMLVSILGFAFLSEDASLIDRILTAILTGLNLSAIVATGKK